MKAKHAKWTHFQSVCFLLNKERMENINNNNNNYNKRILRGNISRQAEVIKQTTKTTKITDLLNVRLDEM